MKASLVRRSLWCLYLVFLSSALMAQNNAALTGKVKDDAGHPVANATVSVKNTQSAQAAEVITGADGSYSRADLPPGEYEISVSAPNFNTTTQKVTLTAGANAALNFTLSPPLSVESLGFPSSVTKSNPQEQARLDKRSHMLKMHQRLGLIATVPMVAALFTGNLAGGRSTSSTGRDVHVALGSTTAGLYFASAYYAIAAPKIAGTETRGNIRLHKMLAWVHGPGMVLTPILGAMAYQQKSNGERVHGIASAHVPVAVITAGAYGLAILTVSLHSGRRHVSSDTQP